MTPDFARRLAFGLNVVSAIAALIAAALWFWSTRVQVEYEEPEPVNGWHGASLTVESSEGKRIDPWQTGVAQAKWNRWAAMAASVAALCQGVATLLVS